MFSPSNMLLKYLNARPRDIYDIVGALEGYINADPKFLTNDFMEAINYVLSNGVSRSELFQDFNSDIEFIEDESKWDYDYYTLARVYLKDNFCEKRINHVKAIAGKLYPSSASYVHTTASAQQEQIQGMESRKSEGYVGQQIGGQQVTEKKLPDQPNKDNSQITQIPRSVKIGGLIVLSVALVLLIVFIIK